MTGFAVVFTFLFHITFFSGCVALSGYCEQRNLHSVICCKVQPLSKSSKYCNCYIYRNIILSISRRIVFKSSYKTIIIYGMMVILGNLLISNSNYSQMLISCKFTIVFSCCGSLLFTTVRNLVTSAWRIDVTSTDRHALRSKTVNSLDHTVLCKGKSLLSLYSFFETLSLQRL